MEYAKWTSETAVLLAPSPPSPSVSRLPQVTPEWQEMARPSALLPARELEPQSPFPTRASEGSRWEHGEEGEGQEEDDRYTVRFGFIPREEWWERS